jgi:hypothetical protein
MKVENTITINESIDAQRLCFVNLRALRGNPLLPLAEIISNVHLTLTFDPPNRHPLREPE